MKRYIYMILAGAFALTSCNDFLSKSPDNRTELDSPEAVAELLVSAYPEALYQSFTEVMSDNAGDKGKGRYVAEYIPNEYAYFWKDDATDQYDTPTFYWNACYTAIAAANQVLDAIEKNGNGKEYEAQRGEAHAARAYAHFMLTNIFAMHYNPQTAQTNLAVPFVNEPENVVFKEYERKTVQELYDLIEQDLTEALKYCKDEAYTAPKYHFTKDALHAFASRFYLYKGDWDKVIDYSNKVLGNNPVDKVRDWNGKYLAYEASELWFQYTKAEESANILLTRAYTQWGSGFVVFRYSLAPQKITELFSTDYSTRFETVISDKILYAAGDQQMGFVPKYKPRIESVDNSNPDLGYPNSISPAFTMEEVLFNRSEAYAMKKEYDKALVDLDFYVQKRVRGYSELKRPTLESIAKLYEIQKGPDLTPFYPVLSGDQTNILWYLLDMRRREFVHEGLRWFDLKRFDIEVIHDTFDGPAVTLPKGDLRRAVQIPSQAIATGLKPNPR